ncbi:MAG: DUF6249 domain-containing protein [Bacteroidota bacterium]
MLAEILIPITFFASVVGILYMYFTTRHKERMSMLEKGADPTLFQTKPQSTSFILKFGMLMVGVSIGIITGWKLAGSEDEMEIIMPATIFLFGGAALVATYFLERHLKSKDETNVSDSAS